jgi:hypothetical protein
MKIVGGVDCGLNGALALYDYEGKRIVDVIDMPTFVMPINKKLRKRIDTVALNNWFKMASICGIEMMAIEAVGGRPQQSASGAFVFGYTVGLVFMGAVMHRIPLETPPSMTWKKVMKVPGKRTATGKIKPHADREIVSRADELMPEHTQLWRGPKGGLNIDRAEACMIAKYCGDYLTTGANAVSREKGFVRTETKIYMEAETGA